MKHALPLLVILGLQGMRYLQLDGRVAPDCQRYLDMVVGRKVPSPFCYRVGLPWFSRLFYIGKKLNPMHILRTISTVGVFACVASVYFLTLSLGGDQWQATVAAIVVVMTDGVGGNWVMFPWLTDSWAYTFAATASLFGPVPAAVLLTAAAVTKEPSWAIGGLFYLLLFGWDMWWVLLPGAAALALLRLVIKPAPPDCEYLKNQFHYTHVTKMRSWFSFQRNVSHLKLTPWFALYVLPGTGSGVTALSMAALCWAQTLVAVDHARLIGVMSIFIAPLVAVHAAPWVLGVWALGSVYWPFETEYA